MSIAKATRLSYLYRSDHSRIGHDFIKEPCGDRLKLSDYVASFIADLGVRDVFVLSGGASLHLIHSIAKQQGLNYVCLAHEQANAMAADGYARATGKIGVSVATSGPGATNLLTGVCCAYYDSVPTLFLTGQVATFRFAGKTGVRQYGFQETSTVEIFRSVTKYSVLVEDPLMIRYELEKATYLATSGRPGPVLVDIPDDLQRTEIAPEKLKGFVPPSADTSLSASKEQISECLELLYSAKRPLFIAGWGIRLGGAMDEMRSFLKASNLPVAPTWAMKDSVSDDDARKVGTFGTHGTREGNFAVQNADLILSVGSRLDTHATGSPLSSFAREAKKIVVDIDRAELNKFSQFGMAAHSEICADSKAFLAALARAYDPSKASSHAEWKSYLAKLRETFSHKDLAFSESPQDADPYEIVRELSKAMTGGETIFIDTGCAIAWMMQAFRTKPGQRLFHDFNNTAMGWALPAAIGGAFANPGQPIYCVTGDGSLMMNIQELASVVHHRLPIKIMLLNNHGHSMIQQTQEQWLDSEYHASSPAGGLGLPDFVAVAKAFGLPTLDVRKASELRSAVADFVSAKGPIFCNVEIASEKRVVPQTKYGRPIEDSEPLLSRAAFLEKMLVAPLPVSRDEIV